MEESEKLAALHKKMEMHELKTTLEKLWTYCAGESYSEFDRYVEGCGGTFLGENKTGTEVRINFGGGKGYSKRQGKFYYG